MKITNKTAFDTRAIKRLLEAVAKLGELEPERAKRVHAEIVYAQRTHGYVTGCAFIGGFYCKIRIPKPKSGEEAADSAMVAHVAAHEFAHIRGLRHRQMGPRYGWPGFRERYAWATDPKYRIPFVVKGKRPRPSPEDRLGAKLVSIERRQKAWNTKLKRAQNAMLRLAKQKKQIERKMAATKAGG